MTDLSMARLTPYWFQPVYENDGGVRFKLRPLTQPQISELEATFEESKPTNGTFYLAGSMAIEGGRDIENLTIDGKKAIWGMHKDLIPYTWVVECGIDVFVNAYGNEEREKNS
jgi:hypothetical protein